MKRNNIIAELVKILSVLFYTTSYLLHLAKIIFIHKYHISYFRLSWGMSHNVILSFYIESVFHYDIIKKNHEELKMTHRPFRLFTMFLCIISFSNVFTIGKNQIGKLEETKPIQKSYKDASQNVSITPINAERSFSNVEEEFSFECDSEIDEVSVAEGTSVLSSYSIKGNKITCLIKGISDCSYIKLSFLNDTKVIDTVDLYFAQSSDNLFYSSSLTMDAAKRAAGKILNYSLSHEEENTNDTSKSIAIASLGVVGSVSGTLKWTDEQGGEHLLIGAKIKVTIVGSWWSAETYTNQDGYYSISYNDIWYVGSGKPTIHIYAENENVKVHNGGTYEHSYEFDGSSGNWDYSYTFSPLDDRDGDMGKAMMIFQGAKNFSDYAKYLNGDNSISFCNFKYPHSDNGCSYDGNGTVRICAKDTSDSSKYPSSYAAWDVIGHEYGHHIQHYFGIANNPGGKHAANSNNIDEQHKGGESLANAKDKGQRLSWGEAWPTYWSTLAQSHFSDNLKSIFTVGDTLYTSYNTVNYNLNSDSFGKGDADEIAIQRFLFKITDQAIDNYDKFSLGEYALWNIVIKNKPFTFSEFINGLYNEGYNKHDIGLLLSRYSIITDKMSVTNNIYFDKLPTFTWSTYMGSDVLRFNQFDLYFETLSGEIIEKIESLSTSEDYASYSPSISLWGKIYNSDGAKFNVYFVARQTLSYVSGNYYSEIFTFDKPYTYSSDKIQIKPNEWGFEGRYYFSNEIENDNTNRYSTLTKSGLSISTDRLRCGYIENSYINLSPRREGAGLAYFEVGFNKPIYSFLYSICLWGSAELLDGSAIMQIKDNEGNWTAKRDLKPYLENNYRANGPRRYVYAAFEGIYGIRFEATATATGARNKGRVCIDDLVFCTNPNMLDNVYYITNYSKTSA